MYHQTVCSSVKIVLHFSDAQPNVIVEKDVTLFLPSFLPSFLPEQCIITGVVCTKGMQSVLNHQNTAE